jgi:hypothetical protein
MNTPIEISVLADYINQIEDIIHPEKNYLYRGQENEEWKVNSSAYRRLESSASPAEKRYERFSDLLRYQYRGYLLQIIDEIQLKYPATYKNLHPLECMAHLQHNKVATGLIDFTFSPLASLWFACANKDINGKVIVLENDSEKIKEIKTVEVLQRDLETFFDVNQEQWYLWVPTLDSRMVDTERMTMQQSAFLFGLPEISEEMIAQEIVIRSDDKERLRTGLGKMGISEQTLFSDLLGFFERNTHEQPYDRTLSEPYYGGSLS